MANIKREKKSYQFEWRLSERSLDRNLEDELISSIDRSDERMVVKCPALHAPPSGLMQAERHCQESVFHRRNVVGFQLG